MENTIYLTSDLWLYRDNAVSLLDRPFENETEMTTKLISNWNDVVNENDVVYILGNFVYDFNRYQQTLSVLNGVKILLPTEMDRTIMCSSKYMMKLVESFYDIDLSAELSESYKKENNLTDNGLKILSKEMCSGTIPANYEYNMIKHMIKSNIYDFILLRESIVEIPKLGIVLSHWPLLDWNGKENGVINIHGGHIASDQNGERVNICADFWGFCPISLSDILNVTKLKRK